MEFPEGAVKPGDSKRYPDSSDSNDSISTKDNTYERHRKSHRKKKSSNYSQDIENLGRKRKRRRCQHRRRRRIRSQSSSTSSSDSSLTKKRRKSSKDHERRSRQKRKFKTRKHARTMSDDSVSNDRRRKKHSKNEKKKKSKKKEVQLTTSTKQQDLKESNIGIKKTRIEENTINRAIISSQIKDHRNEDETAIENDKKKKEKTNSMIPMTREQYEAQQSIIREVYDPQSGRTRLVKGTGEIIERIVSRSDHLRINKVATQGDGLSFSRSIMHSLGKSSHK